MEKINISISNKEIPEDSVSKWENFQKLIKEELILNEISKKFFII